MIASLHAIHYIQDGDLIRKISMDPTLQSYVEETIIPAMAILSEEDYWHGPAKNMCMATRQSYFAWDGRSYWCIEDEVFTVVEFAPQSLRIASLPFDYGEEEGELTPQYELIFTPWDAMMENDLAAWKPISSPERKAIEKNVMWTNDLHERMEKITPMSKLLSS